MTALPTGMSRGDDRAWLELGEAARRLGVSDGALRRRCAEELAERGLAERRVSARSGRRVWHLHTAADPKLDSPVRLSDHGADGGESAEAILARRPGGKVEQAQRRALCLADFIAWRRGGAVVTRDYPVFRERLRRERGLAPSLSQMYAWAEACDPEAGFAERTLALLDTRGRGRGAGKSDCDERAWRMFVQLYLAPNQLSVAHCWRVVRAEAQRRGWPWPSLRRVQMLARERIEPSVADYHRLGRTAWRSRHKAPIEQDPDAWAPGECWEADHTTCDLFVCARDARGRTVARRPVLTMWYDRRTRMICGAHVSLRGDSDAIRAALLDALKRDGVDPPRYAWLDNGRDFASSQFIGATKAQRREQIENEWSGLLARLGIEAHFAQPYNHDGKARIERRYGFIHSDVDRTFHSWTGSDHRQVDKFQRRDTLKAPEELPTIDEYRAAIRKWIEWHNHWDEHNIDDLRDERGRRLAPAEMYAQRPTRRVLPDRGALSLLEQAWARPMKVSKRGVGLRIGGRTIFYGAGDAVLGALRGTGRRVHVTYDPADMTRVRIYDEQMRYLATVEANELYGGPGVDKDDLKAAIAQRRAAERAARTAIDTGAMTGSDIERARDLQRQRDIKATRQRIAAETGAQPQAPLRIVRTGLEGEAQRVRENEQRLAAGAENQPRRSPRSVILEQLAAEHAAPPADETAKRDIFDLTGEVEL